jgi:hypothetical protein
LRAALAGLELSTGSLLESTGKGRPLREVAVTGHQHDPLNAIVNPGIGSVATSLLERGETLLCCDPVGELLFGQAHPGLEGVRGVLAVPMRGARSSADTLLLLYTDATTRDLDQDDAEFATAIAQITSLALRSIPVRV